MFIDTIETSHSVEPVTYWQEQAQILINRAGGILHSLDDKPAVWPLRFPSNDEHPGFGLKGEPGYESQQDGVLTIEEGNGLLAVTLQAIPGQHIKRPRSQQSSFGDPESIEDTKFIALQVVVDPDLEKAFIMYGIDEAGNYHGLLGVSTHDAEVFTDVCLLQAEKKQGIERPSRAAALDEKLKALR
jgi:hypothetical protein